MKEIKKQPIKDEPETIIVTIIALFILEEYYKL
jgi:hypothetical protein